MDPRRGPGPSKYGFGPGPSKYGLGPCTPGMDPLFLLHVPLKQVIIKVMSA